MNPLFRRILIRGTLVAAATVGVALLFRQLLESMLMSNAPKGETPSAAFGLQGPIVWGLFGFVLVALLEWLSDRKERKKNQSR